MKRDEVNTKHGAYVLTTVKIWNMDRIRSVTSLFWSKMEKMFWLLAKAKSFSKNSYHLKFTDKGIA